MSQYRWLSMVEHGVHVVERNCHLSTTGKMVYGGSAKSGHRDNMMSRTTTGYEDKQTQRGYTSCIFSTNCLIFLKDTEISWMDIFGTTTNARISYCYHSKEFDWKTF